ncbi:MAG: hypothetical protein ABI876_08100, partial [Bacteroidota bacterium]
MTRQSSGGHAPLVALLLATLLLFLQPLLLPAQGGRPQPKGYHFDSTFQMGALGLKYANIAADSLHLNYTRFYGGPVRYDSLGHTGFDAEQRMIYQGIYDHRATLKVVLPPAPIVDVIRAGNAAINDYGYNQDSIHGSQFGSLGDVGPSDSIYNHHFWGKRVAAHPDSAPALIAGRSCYTWNGLYLGGTDTTLLRTRVNNSHYHDSSQYYDVTVTMIADSLASIVHPIGDNTLIAYLILYRRVMAGQPSTCDCKCNFYSRFDSLPITKAMYLNSYLDPNPNSPYRNVPCLFKFPKRDTVVFGRNLVIPITAIRGDTAIRTGDSVISYEPTGGLHMDYGHFTFPDDSVDTGGRTSRGRFCARLHDSLVALAAGGITVAPVNTEAINQDVTESDFYFDLYTTQKVPITFQHTTTTPHSYTQLNNGGYDRHIDSVMNLFVHDRIMSKIIKYVGLADEPKMRVWKICGTISSKMQRSMIKADSTLASFVGTYGNPIGEDGTFRIRSGDIDSTDIKMLHYTATQAYHMSGAIPITYANPDLMADSAINGYYGMRYPDLLSGGDTIRRRTIMGNSAPDYAYYTRASQANLTLVRVTAYEAVDVSRFRYNYLSTTVPYPVALMVQMQGFFGDDGPRGFFFNGWRPPPPEEITAQAWEVIGSGMDGLCFADFDWDGAEIGVITEDTTFDHSTDYGTFKLAGVDRAPRMWMGLGKRFNAIRSIIDTFHLRILPTYDNIDRNGSHISLYLDSLARAHWREAMSFAQMPVLDTLKAERAVRDSVAFLPSGVYDAASQTFMDVTVFKPGPKQILGGDGDSRFVLFINRRCWPIDFGTYNDSNRAFFSRVAPYDTLPFSTKGLGNIDVRRPVVVLKNSTGTMADSMMITRVGDSAWSLRARIGDTVQLDWLKPGAGQMYKVKPISAGVSAYGTAYNNAVHGENPSTDSTQRDRFFVYERDSA